MCSVPWLLCSPAESLRCAEVTQVLQQRHRQPNSIHSCMQFFLRSGRLCFKVSHCACSFSACCCPLQAITGADRYWQQSCGTTGRLETSPLHSLLCAQAAPAACAEEKAPSEPWQWVRRRRNCPVWAFGQRFTFVGTSGGGHGSCVSGTPQPSLLTRHTSQLFLIISSCTASKTGATSFHVLLGFILAFFLTCKVEKYEVKKWLHENGIYCEL